VAASNGHVPPANVAHAPDLPVADNGLAPVERTHKQIALAQLLVRQDQLAMLTTAEAEAEYAANGKLIQELSA
jgi:hypothetical protein